MDIICEGWHSVLATNKERLVSLGCLGLGQNMHLARRWHFVSNIPVLDISGRLLWDILFLFARDDDWYQDSHFPAQTLLLLVMWWLSTSPKMWNWRPVLHNVRDLITFLLLLTSFKVPLEWNSMNIDWVVIILVIVNSLKGKCYRPASFTSENNFRCQQIIDFIVLARNT